MTAAVTDNWQNKLYFGDNLVIMREHVPDESVDKLCLYLPYYNECKIGEHSAVLYSWQ